MSRYIFIRRLTGPAILLLFGTVALLHEAHVVSWDIFGPLLLILIGVIMLAKRAALANEPYPPASPHQGGVPPQSQTPPYGAPQYPTPPRAPAPQYPAQTAIVPTSHDFSQDPKGGNS